MPNVSGHLYTAYRVEGPDVSSAFMLGAVLPDFRAMYQDAAGRRILANSFEDRGDLGKGKAFHQTTDKIFNGRPEFKEAESTLQAAFVLHGLEPRAAKLSAHLLGKIMADRAIFEIPIERAVVVQASQIALEGLSILNESDVDGNLVPTIRNYLERVTFSRYSDTTHLAELTYGRLQDRANTSKKRKDRTIKFHEVEEVAKVLKAEADNVGRLGLSALQSTVEILRSA